MRKQEDMCKRAQKTWELSNRHESSARVSLFIVREQGSYYNATTGPNYLPCQYSTQSREQFKILHYKVAFWHSYEMLPRVGVCVATFDRSLMLDL
jgi:hypothetical protein